MSNCLAIPYATIQQRNGNEIAKMQTAQLLEADWYNLRELQIELAPYRGKRIPDRTLRWWLAQLRIKPNQYGFYEADDRDLLIRLVLWLGRGKTLNAFKQLILEEPDNAN